MRGRAARRNTVLADWRTTIDRVVVVTAPDEVKIARYVARSGTGCRRDREAAEADARARLAHQIPDAEKAARADYVHGKHRRSKPLCSAQVLDALAAAEGGEQQISRRWFIKIRKMAAPSLRNRSAPSAYISVSFRIVGHRQIRN